MDKQEYKHIRNLAWDLLIDANISSLPVDISKIAALYKFESFINPFKSRYENTLAISEKILNLFGYNSSFSQTLAIRILSPMIVLKSLNIKSAAEINQFTDLPIKLCFNRFERYKTLLVRNAFCTSTLEVKVLSQFQNWIDNYLLSHLK